MSVSAPDAQCHRGVAQLARASVSKTEGRGFKSLHPCQATNHYRTQKPPIRLLLGTVELIQLI